MNALCRLILPFALVLGACDSDEPIAGDTEAVDASPRKARHGGKLAKLDVDADGSLSRAEAEGTKLAVLFDELDANGDDRLDKDELVAAKKARHRGKGKGDPAERAAKLIVKLDADEDGTLSLAESASHRFLGKKFATIDADADGKLTAAELTAFKAKHERGKHGRRAEAAG